MFSVIILIVAGILFIIILTFAYGAFRAAPWLPTRSVDIERIVKLADIKSGQKIYDLGCGDGRFIEAAAKEGAIAVGYEISILPYILAKIRLMKFGKNAKVKYRDFWFSNLNDADTIYFFLTPKIFSKIHSKFKKELKPGTSVISYVWPLENMEPIKVDKVEGQANMYLYKF